MFWQQRHVILSKHNSTDPWDPDKSQPLQKHTLIKQFPQFQSHQIAL